MARTSCRKPKKKCCIRSSKLRKCTLKNMCPRKRCKKGGDVSVLEKKLVALEQKHQRDLQAHQETIRRQQQSIAVNGMNQALVSRYQKEAEERLQKINQDSQKIQELNTKLQQASQNVSQLTSETGRLNFEKQQILSEKMKLAEEKRNLQQEKQRLSEEKSKLIVEKGILNHALNGLSASGRNAIEKLSKQIKESRSELTEKVNELSKIRASANWNKVKNTVSVDKLQKDILSKNEIYKNLIKEYKSKLNECGSQLKNCKESKIEIEDLKKSLQSEVLKFKTDNDIQKTLLNALKQQNQRLIENVSQVTKERDAIKLSCANLSGSSKEMVSKLQESLRVCGEKLNAAIQNGDSTATKLNQEYISLQEQLKKCTFEKGTLKVQIEQTERTHTDTVKSLLDQIKECQTKMNTNLNLQKWKTAAKGSVLQKEYQQLQSEYNSKVAELQKLQSDSSAEIESLKKQLNEYANDINKKIAQQKWQSASLKGVSAEQKKSLQQEIESMKKEYFAAEKMLKTRIEELEKSNRTLRADSVNCASQRQQLEKQFQACQANEASLNAMLIELKEQNKSAGAEITELKAYIELSKDNIKRLQSERENLAENLKTLGNAKEESIKLAKDLESANKRFIDLQKEFNSKSLKIAELEKQLGLSLEDATKKSQEANEVNKELLNLKNQLNVLKSKENVQTDTIKQLESNISKLNGMLGVLQTDIGEKNEKMNKLINEIAKQTIDQLISSYQDMAQEYSRKNAQLSASQRNVTPEQRQLVQAQIENNNQIIDTINEQLRILREQQRKVEEDKIKLEQINKKAQFDFLINTARAKRDQRNLQTQLFRSNVDRLKAEKAEAERQRLEAIRLEKERQDAILAQELAKLKDIINDLKNVDPMTLYLKEILSGYSNKPEAIINGKDIYQNLTIYNQQLKNVGLNDLFKQVKARMVFDAESFRQDAKTAGKESLINNFIRTLNDISPISTYTDDLNQLKQKIAKLFDLYVSLKDSIYPVRIIINFGNILAKNTPVTNESVPENNFNAGKVSGDPRKIKNIITKDTEGPFYEVTTTSSNNYPVNEDILRVFNPEKDDSGNVKIPHLIYSAYGFSGSGKSFTLIAKDNKNNLLARVIKSIKSNANQGTFLRYTIYDNYGEMNDGGCNVLTGENEVNDSTPINKNTGFVVNKQIKLDDYQKIEDDINAFEKQRQQMILNKNGRSEFHIRFTPNNDQSSRSHLFIDIDIMESNITKGRITIIDMAGSEDVNTIQNSYFESIPTNYTGDAMVKSLENISTTISHLVDNISKVSSQLRSGDVNTNSRVASELGMINFITGDNAIQPFELIDKKGSYIKKDAWTALMNNFYTLKINLDYSDMKNFINDYNFYNYYSKIVYPIYQLKTKILKTFNTGYFKLTNSCNDCASFEKLNKIFELVGLNPLPNIYLDLSGLKPVIENSLKSDTDKRQAASNIPKFFKLMSNKLQPQIDNIYSVLINSQNGDFIKIVNFYNKDLEESKKKMIKSMEIDPNDINGSIRRIREQRENTNNIINKWNKDYLYKFHCSIRYQGVYIVHTLEQMKKYISCLQNQKYLTSQFPGNLLHKPLQLNGTTRDALSNYAAKFILFNNIRLDFSTNDQNIKPGAEQQNKNISDAYENSIKFADSINPLRSGGLPSCESSWSFGKKRTIKKRKGKRNVKSAIFKLISDYKYITSL
jgi:hypothetical protein